MSKKVLMVCYYFPPIQSAGCTRSVEFARHLPACGWDPTVLTVRETKDPWVRTGAPVPSGVSIVRTPEWSLARVVDLADALAARVRRLLGLGHAVSWGRELACWPDSQIAWFATLPAALLARRHDAIYVSCSPYSAALKGCLVKLLTGKPLVVDLRDAWTLNPHASHTSIHSSASARAERLVFALADRIILNTEGARRLYAAEYPWAAARLSVIPNGHDVLDARATEAPRGPFRVMHFGSFYGSRQPDALLEALRSLGLPIEFVQVGGGYAAPREAGVPVRVIDTLPRERALELMKTASLLYLRQGREPGVKHHIAVAAKTYEYLATGLPILADVPEGDNAEVVERYAARAHVVKSGSAGDLAAAIRTAYEERETVVPCVKPELLRDFDRRHLTASLARVLDDLAPAPSPQIHSVTLALADTPAPRQGACAHAWSSPSAISPASSS